MSDVELEGGYPSTPRFQTGIYSLDYALGNPVRGDLGLPLGTYYMLYGHTHQGKSTLSYFLSSKVPGSVINICDLEGCDREYVRQCAISAGFKGKIRFVEGTDEKDKPRTHAQMLTEMINNVAKQDTTNVGLFDSVGAYITVAEGNNDIDDANMGVRAKQMGNAARKMVSFYNGLPKTAIVIAHSHGVIGGQGHLIPGGEALKSLAGVHIYIYSKGTIDTGTGDEKEILGYLIGGTVEKLRFGGKGRRFQVFNIPGYGISPEMSAVFDCFTYKLAERSTTVKIGDKSFGYISKLIDSAIRGDKEKFEPFFEALDKYRQENMFTRGGEE